ncbi:glutamate-1-semialdehyde aminotransferase [Listeria cornellensis FSL F6-0969]|uniref:Glutamate-1-semialdehyde aminotransferase n=1 Tax=Listeria cornellensis FSL F6-0969 TaxID=1265820 RepID=W7BRQ6_9LIST|nr:glutamate-1-semialdehyde aminotransferase [Listeria cornellensis FSL F6-0969]
MNAGYATLKQLTPHHYDAFRTLIDQLEEGLELLSKQYEVPLSINRAGSMFGFFFTDQKVTNYDTAKTSDLTYFSNYYREMLNNGIFLPPSQYEGLFISTEHTDVEISKTLEAIEASMKALR